MEERMTAPRKALAKLRTVKLRTRMARMASIMMLADSVSRPTAKSLSGVVRNDIAGPIEVLTIP